MQVRKRATGIVLTLGLLGFTAACAPATASQAEAANAATAHKAYLADADVNAATAAIPAGDSLVSVPGGGQANLRYDACLSVDYAPQNPYAPYDQCGISAAVADGSYVTMRCWTDDEAPVSENKAWTSPRWFYVTLDSGNPETAVSGFIYSALIPVASQVATPNCDTSDYNLLYPFQPGDSSAEISAVADGSLTVDMDNIALGPAAVYCHSGTGYPTGGSVTYLGKYTLTSESLQVPLCGSGTQWVGIIASDGIIRYTSVVTAG
jgi:hypothetical protein